MCNHGFNGDFDQRLLKSLIKVVCDLSNDDIAGDFGWPLKVILATANLFKAKISQKPLCRVQSRATRESLSVLSYSNGWKLITDHCFSLSHNSKTSRKISETVRRGCSCYNETLIGSHMSSDE